MYAREKEREPGSLPGSPPSGVIVPRSLHDPRHHAGADRAAAFADGEAGVLRQGDGLVEFDRELRAVALDSRFRGGDT